MEHNALVKFLNNHYGLDIAAGAVLRDGPDNTTWKLEGRDGARYVARVSKRETFKNIAFEIEWLRFLQSRQIPVALVIDSKNGQSHVSLPNGIVTMFGFVEGAHLIHGPGASLPHKAVSAAARALAELHNTSHIHTVSSPATRTVFSELERVIARATELDALEGGTEFLHETERYLAWGKEFSYVPGLVHNDYRIGNILFDPRETVAAILDFDWACMGPQIKDLAHALMEWSFPDAASSPSTEVLNVFLNSYNENSDHPFENNVDLYQWACFSALSDTGTFLCDRLGGPAKKIPADSFMYKKFAYFAKKAERPAAH